MTKEKTWTSWVLVLCLLLPSSVISDASPDAEPQADALASAMAEALAEPLAQSDPGADADAQQPPQYYGVRPPYVYPGSRPPYLGGGGGGGGGSSSPPSACELTNQCCGLANNRCCLQGQQGQQQKCYTVWERKCEVEDNPECRVRLEQKCYSVRVKDCQVVTEVTYRPFKTSYCTPKPMNKCFTYEKKVCTPDKEPAYSDISWDNERLQVSSNDHKVFCTDIKTYNCTPTLVQETVTDKVRRPVVTQQVQKRCRMVQSMGQSHTVDVPVVKIVYKNVCYNVNVPQCSTNACGTTGYCSQGQSVCSQNEFNTQTVCPINAVGQGGQGGPAISPAGPQVVGGGGGGLLQQQNCQQIREPVCANGVGGGNCNPGYQQCCSNTQQRICRQVPQKVVEKVQQTMPGQVSWKEECSDFPYNVTNYEFDDVQRIVNRTKQLCDPVVKNECHNFSIPVYSVVPEAKVERVTVMVPACKHRVVQDRYCHTFPTGDFDCRDTTIQRGFRINKIKCDRERDRPFCFTIPIADCRLGTNTNCRMVPRQVCQSTCSSDPLCNTCNQFVQQGPGFGSCPSSTCGNYYPNDPWWNNNNGTGGMGGPWDSGINELPPGGGGGWLHPGGGGGMGGEGYYPGNGGGVGGEGYYPGAGGGGGGMGGEGFFPGTGGGGGPGGEGYYPGVGGEGGYFPGGPNGGGGGEEYFPGTGGGGGMGGEGYYPGVGGGGGEGFYPGGPVGGGGGEDFYPGDGGHGGGENFFPGHGGGGGGGGGMYYPPGGSVGGQGSYPGNDDGGVFYGGYSSGYADQSSAAAAGGAAGGGGGGAAGQEQSLRFDAQEAVKEEKSSESLVKGDKEEAEQIKE